MNGEKEAIQQLSDQLSGAATGKDELVEPTPTPTEELLTKKDAAAEYLKNEDGVVTKAHLEARLRRLLDNFSQAEDQTHLLGGKLYASIHLYDTAELFTATNHEDAFAELMGLISDISPYRTFVVETGESVTKGDIVEVMPDGKIQRFRENDDITQLALVSTGTLPFLSIYDEFKFGSGPGHIFRHNGLGNVALMSRWGNGGGLGLGASVGIPYAGNRHEQYPYDENAVAVCYEAAGPVNHIRSVTKDKNTLTLGTLYSSAEGMFGNFAMLDVSLFFKSYQVSTTSNKARTISRSGTTYTWNAAAVNTETTYYNGMVLLTATKALVTFWTNTTSGYLKGLVATISGTSVSFGSSQNLLNMNGYTNLATFGRCHCRIDDTHAIVVFRCNHATNGPTQAVVITESSGTLTAGTPVQLTWTTVGSAVTLSMLNMFRISTYRYLVWARVAGTPVNGMWYLAVDPSTYAITILDGDNDLWETSHGCAIKMNQRQYVLETATDYYVIQPWRSPLGNIVGIANETKGAGENCVVVCEGGKYTETGKFITGRPVGVGLDGSLETKLLSHNWEPTDSPTTFAFDNEIGYALNANEMIVRRNFRERSNG